MAADDTGMTSDDDLSDRLLVAGAVAGLPEARERLGQRYGRIAYLLALHLTGNREDARDLSQDAMLRFFAGLQRLDLARDPRPWVLAIVRNLVRDRWRRRRTVPAMADRGLELAEMIASPAAGPDVRLDRTELQRRVWRAIGSLSADKREILVLRDFNDLTYGDIAQLLGIPLGTVMSRLHAARTALRHAMITNAHHD